MPKSHRPEDFKAEINDLFEKYDFNFGANSVPFEIVKNSVLKFVCGWHNGGTAQSIIVTLGYVKEKRKKSGELVKSKLTKKGQLFLWTACTGDC